MTDMLATLTSQTFKNIQNRMFQMHTPSGVFSVELVEVDDSRSPPSADFRAPLSLLFKAPVEANLPQGSYRFDHDVLGSMEVFAVRIHHKDTAPHFQVIFN